MKRKIVYVFVVLFSISSLLKAQSPLTADAGPDTLLCINGNNPQDSNKIGGHPTAFGGKAPYKYEWKIYSKTTKNESTFFDFNSINRYVSNPFLDRTVHFLPPDLSGDYILKVIVTDENNTIAIDSSVIRISIFNIGDLMLYPKQDSVMIAPLVEGGMKPLIFNWTPSVGLSDSHIQTPTAKRMYPNINYSIEITDAATCKFKITDFITITDIKNGDLKTGYVSYKNPVSSSGTMNFTSELIGSTIRISSVTGTVLYQTKIEEPSIPVGSIIKTPGIYYYNVATTQGKVISGSFIKE